MIKDDEIERILPHRYPMLMVDNIIAVDPSGSIEAVKNISRSDPVLQGHFPGMPIFPGVLMLESLAQTAGVLLEKIGHAKEKSFVLAKVDFARFKRIVQPGDQLHLSVKLLRNKMTFFEFSGVAAVNGDEVMSAGFSLVKGGISG